MKWSDYNSDFYIPYDENQRAIRGSWLTTLGINLEKIPMIFHEPFHYYESNGTHKDVLIARKVMLSEIVGTSNSDYGGTKIIESFIRIKRASSYIANGCVTRNKYFYILKKPVYKQINPIILSYLDDGKYFVDGNGNHRIILYKIMMLAEIADVHPYVSAEDYNCSSMVFNNIRKKYWLNAMVRSAE